MPVNADCALTEQIAGLSTLSLEQLRVRWQTNFGRAASAHLTRALLLRLFIYRLQVEVYGDLGSGTVQLLDRLSREDIADSEKSIPLHSGGSSREQLRPGTLLTREHGGIHHRVFVAERGYEWNGHSYSSLSQVATAITGTRWNGPRFFGLPSSRAAR